jgi:hypothetical protein
MRQELAIVHVLVAIGLFAGPMASAQVPAPPSLKDQLEAQYKTSTVLTDGNVQNPGTVLVIQQNGVLGVSLADAAIPPATCKEGILHKPGAGIKFMSGVAAGMGPNSKGGGQDTRPFPVGDKVYILKLDVNVKKDRIAFVVAECASCNGTDPSTAYKAAVSFDFAKGSLANMDVPEVEDAIAKVFTFDTSATAAQPGQPEPQKEPAVAQSAPPPAAPPSIQLGQTIDQVVAAIGQPEKIADLGTKKIYTYKDLKVIFVNGVVSDVQ